MELRDLGKTLARWWYLTLAVLLVSLAAGFSLYKSTGPTYEAESTVLLLPPTAVVEVAAASNPAAVKNPLLYLASLTDSRDMVVRALAGHDAVEAIDKAAPNATVEAAGDPTSQSPLIVITSEGDTEADALSGLKAVGTLIPKTLDDIQNQLEIEKPQRITTLAVTSDTAGTPAYKKALELAVVGFGGSLLVGLLLIGLLDAAVRRRRESADERSLAAAPQQRRVDSRATHQPYSPRPTLAEEPARRAAARPADEPLDAGADDRGATASEAVDGSNSVTVDDDLDATRKIDAIGKN